MYLLASFEFVCKPWRTDSHSLDLRLGQGRSPDRRVKPYCFKKGQWSAHRQSYGVRDWVVLPTDSWSGRAVTWNFGKR